ncbi:MAG: restriction endonuclease subunit S [Bacteroidota bacterium]|nr:restriction endonuclease subunit S [Bacteroidota bacterium]
MEKEIISNTINEVPKGWIVAKLSDMVVDPKKDFVDGPFGSDLKASEYKDEGVPVFRIQNIKAGYFLDKNIQFVTKQKAEQLKRHSFKQGDIIITKLGEPLGLCCKVPHKYPEGIIVADLMRVRPSPTIVDTDYLVYAINSKIIQDQFKNITKGTTRARVNLSIVRDIEIPIAPASEQKRIVNKLEELISELEKGKEHIQISLEQLRVYKQSVLKFAFEGKLTEEWRNKQKKLKTPNELVAEINNEREKKYNNLLSNYREGLTKVKPQIPKEISLISQNELLELPKLPDGWCWIKVASLGAIETGTTPSKTRPDNFGVDYPFFKPTELNAGYNVREATEYLSEKGIKSARFLPINSILVTCIGATIGKAGIIRRSGASNQQINAIIPYEIFNPNFIYFQVISRFFQDQIKNNAAATTLPILNKSKFENLYFAICSNEEQNILVNELDNKFSNCENLEITINQSLLKCDTLKQSILQKAFKGKLVKQEPSDESAGVLLDRIKKEREEYIKNEKEKATNLKKMKPKEIINQKDLSLKEIIYNSFSYGEFTFNELRRVVELNYDDLRDELFKLLDEGISIEMYFDKMEEVMKYKYIGK